VIFGNATNPFENVSNGKPPASVSNNVVVCKTPLSIASNTSIPSTYTRDQIAAQFVYELVRNEYLFTNGTNNTITYLPVGAATQQTYSFKATSLVSTQSDKECRNIYVGFCGDGIVDNTSTQSSTDINAKLAG
jgi:hypothetical protein